MDGDLLTAGSLVVLDGGGRGSTFSIGRGRSIVGRLPESDVELPDSTVSRHHAEIEWSARGVLVRDLHSVNGTYVNGSAVRSARELRNGDKLRVGNVTLRFTTGGQQSGSTRDPSDTARSEISNRSLEFGRVDGPVQTGDGRQYVAGRDLYNGRDQYFDQSVDIQEFNEPGMAQLEELASGSGPGRVVMVFGFILAIIGFGLWAYFILSFFGNGDPEVSNPFAQELVPGVPLAAAGFGMFFAGAVISNIGYVMSRAARRRARAAANYGRGRR